MLQDKGLSFLFEAGKRREQGRGGERSSSPTGAMPHWSVTALGPGGTPGVFTHQNHPALRQRASSKDGNRRMEVDRAPWRRDDVLLRGKRVCICPALRTQSLLLADLYPRPPNGGNNNAHFTESLEILLAHAQRANSSRQKGFRNC